MPYSDPPKTPDGRYILVKNRLWRCSDPKLPEHERQHWVNQLMGARRDVGQANKSKDTEAQKRARARVDQAKLALGERGPVWWNDSAPDYTQCKVENTPYAKWAADLKES